MRLEIPQTSGAHRMDSQLSGIFLQGKDHIVRDPEGQNLCRFNRLVAGAQNSNTQWRRPVSNQDSVPQWNVKPALNAPDASSIPSQSCGRAKLTSSPMRVSLEK